MGKEKTPITEKEFEKFKIKLFAQANSELKVFARRLANYCWKLDPFAVLQEWEGKKDRLIAFGVSPENRKEQRTKNYFTIYMVLNSLDRKLKCEVCFPKTSLRKDLLKQNDPQNMLHLNSENQCEGMFETCDYDYVIKLIHASLACRVKE